MVTYIKRFPIDYVNLSHKWTQPEINYNKQYCSIYLIRLREMTKLLEEQAEKKWGKIYPICKLHKLSEEHHSKCIVIGTLFKDQKLKPSILKQIAEGNQLVPQPVITHFTDKSDQLFIEDELQRYHVVSTLNCKDVVTGISCALLGTSDDKGKFIVEDYVFAGYRTQVPRPVYNDTTYVVFLSGLDLVHSDTYAVSLQLLIHWLSGVIGNLNGMESSKIIRIIVAGNNINNISEKLSPSISMISRKPESSDAIKAVQLLDMFLLQVSKTIQVDVMPGENDPSNHILPQRPMHYCMFPKSSINMSLNQVSNPYYCSINGLKILGSSGQPVQDILRYSEMSDPLEALECCLNWNHLAPTAPDTLGCFPFYDKDPFIIEECPHVLFAGNQKIFGTRKCTGGDGQQVTLISVPEFSATLQVCLLNLNNLECNTISFTT